MTMDDKLKSTLDKVVRLTQQNAEFGSELRKALQIKPSASSVYVMDDARLKHIESYLGLDYYIDGQPSLIDFSFVPEAEIRAQLISDNREMMRYRYGTRFHTISFDEFCRYAHLQAEMLLNYFYDKKDNNLEDVKKHILEHNPSAKISEAKSLGAISYSSKLWAFCKEFLIDGRNKTCLDNIREVRNKSSHRSPEAEEITIAESRRKLTNMGIPIHKDEGYVLTWQLKEGTNAYLLYNNMVKNQDWFKEYNFLLWVYNAPYDNIMYALESICGILRTNIHF